MHGKSAFDLAASASERNFVYKMLQAEHAMLRRSPFLTHAKAEGDTMDGACSMLDVDSDTHLTAGYGMSVHKMRNARNVDC